MYKKNTQNKSKRIHLKYFIRLFILPYFLQHKLKFSLSIIGVTLGVAVFIAIRSANISAKKTMHNFILSISANSDLQINSGRNGFSEKYYPKIKLLNGIKEAHVSISRKTQLKINSEYYPILVLGYDILQNKRVPNKIFKKFNQNIEKILRIPNNIIVTESFLKEHKLNQKSKIKLITAKGLVNFDIVGIIKKKDIPYGNEKQILIMDFFAAQYYFNLVNRIDQIDIILNKKSEKLLIKNKLKKLLGDGFTIKTVDNKLKQSGILYKSFNLNLKVVGFTALLVGMYLIFNTINSSVLNQKKEIGILRSLGMSKKDLLLLFILKGLIIGLIGSLFGIFLGWILAQFSIKIFMTQLSRNYLTKNINLIYFSQEIFIKGFIVGLSMTFISSIIPALNALKVSPLKNISSLNFNYIKPLKIYLYFFIGLILLIVAWILAQFKPIMNIPIFGFLANLTIIIAISLILPLGISFIIKQSKKILQHFFGIEIRLACENILKSLGRNTITISTLMISLSLVINIFILIKSYHFTINKWINQVNNADFSIISGSNYKKGDIFPMKENRIKNIENEPLIKDIDYYRFYNTFYKGNKLDIHSFNINIAEKYCKYTFIEGDQKSSFELMKKKEAVLISDGISKKYNIKKGALISLSTPFGKRNFLIAGIVVNYLSNFGVISMNRKTFKNYWKDNKVDIFKLYLKEKTNLLNSKKILYKKIKNSESLVFISLAEFKNDIFESINETFSIFHALELITIIIAFLGLINGLISSILERKKEIAVLRSIGGSLTQIKRIIMLESTLIGFLSSIISVIAGGLLSLVTVFVINHQTVGWLLEIKVPYQILFILLISGISLSTLAGYYPAKQACKISIHNALKYE